MDRSLRRRWTWAVVLRRADAADASRLCALNSLPNVGYTADPNLPLDAPRSAGGPGSFSDLSDVAATFFGIGGEFLVAEHDGYVVGMGGYKPTAPDSVEILRVRVHPAMRRRGVGRVLIRGLEDHARVAGFRRAHLDTADNQPEALAFYQGLGYTEVGRETQPDWNWTLVFFETALQGRG